MKKKKKQPTSNPKYKNQEHKWTEKGRMKHELLELRKEIGEKKAKTNQINLNKEQ